MTTLYFNNQIIAEGFSPADPPAVSLIADWIRLLSLDIKPSALRDKLKAGGSVTVGIYTFEWREE